MHSNLILPQTVKTAEHLLRLGIDQGMIPVSQFEASLQVLNRASENPASTSVQDDDILMTTKKVTKLLDCSAKYVYRLGDQGRLNRVYLTPGKPKSLRFRKSEVKAIMQGEK